jgi:hypothetical protein
MSRIIPIVLALAAAVALIVVGIAVVHAPRSATQAAALSGPVQSGDYTGTTSQGQPVTFTVSGSTVTNIVYGWQANCDDGQSHTNSIAPGDATLNGSSFSVSSTLTTGASAQFAGTISGHSASGTFSRSGGSAFNTNCAASGTWTASASS